MVMLLSLALPVILASSGICRAVDGDTLRCGAENVRLLAIDAPEMPGHCRPGRACAPGDGRASKRHLAALVRGQQVRLLRFGRDRYGRTLAIAWAGRTNLSCAQMQAGLAIYKRQWDKQRRIGRECAQ